MLQLVIERPLCRPVGIDGVACHEKSAVEMYQDGAFSGVYALGDEDVEVDVLVVDGFVGLGCYVEGLETTVVCRRRVGLMALLGSCGGHGEFVEDTSSGMMLFWLWLGNLIVMG